MEFAIAIYLFYFFEKVEDKIKSCVFFNELVGDHLEASRWDASHSYLSMRDI